MLKFLPVTILIAGLMFLGIRGRLAHKSPIRVGTAYFSNYAFPNQLGLNPVYTFLRSYLDSRNPKNKVLHLMNDEEAIKNTRKMFGIDSTLLNISPVARMVNPTGKEVKANVIIIIMESMSAEKMGRFGNTGNLTPHLDSISRISACFDHVYSAGIHTMNGIYSTLFGLPALLRQHPMKGVTIPACSGFSNILPGKGYQTIYITTHDEQFDNVGGFLHANGFQKMISQKDYPSSKVLSTLGVPDHFMFEFSIPFLNDLNKNNQPFFATFVTGSDHGPYIIPEGISFTPHAQNIRQQIVEYADWSIGRFLKLASEQPWFANTIFVFIADHGATLDNSVYDMPLTGNHTPLIIFSSRLVKPSVSKYFGGQIDIFPTVMGLLNIPYVNNTMGVDLFREKRPYMHFSADNKIGCIDENFFYVIRDNKIESLYKYRTNDTKNYLANEKQHADSMKNYAFSMMQTTQWMLLNKKTAVPKPK